MWARCVDVPPRSLLQSQGRRDRGSQFCRPGGRSPVLPERSVSAGRGGALAALSAMCCRAASPGEPQRVSLLTGRRRRHRGDSPAMVAAREQFLSRGHYRPLQSTLTALAVEHSPPGPNLVVDLAGGTGHYLAGVLDGLTSHWGVTVDVSTAALRRAAQARAPRRGAELVRADRSPARDLAAGVASRRGRRARRDGTKRVSRGPAATSGGTRASTRPDRGDRVDRRRRLPTSSIAPVDRLDRVVEEFGLPEIRSDGT
jgi:hypothetical protein